MISFEEIKYFKPGRIFYENDFGICLKMTVLEKIEIHPKSSTNLEEHIRFKAFDEKGIVSHYKARETVPLYWGLYKERRSDKPYAPGFVDAPYNSGN